MNIYVWPVLIISLLVATFGVTLSVTFLVGLVFFIIGFFISLRALYKDESDHWWHDIQRSQIPLPEAYEPGVYEYFERFSEKDEKQDRRITGSTQIDEQVQIVLKLFTRDFIIPWYSQISNNERFITQLQKSIQQTLVEISNRCKNADWMTYLTTRLVDDIAAHLKLFREAKLASRNKGTSSKLLVDNFFDIEVQKENDVCRDNICLTSDAEKDYLSDLLEIILYFVLPPSDFACMPLRSAIIEIILSSVVQPLINQITDSDYINSFIVLTCTDIPVTSDLFLSVIKSTANENELKAVKHFVAKKMGELRSQDSGGREEGNEVKLKIGSIEYLQQVIHTRLNRLDKGTEIDSMGLPVNFDYSRFSRGRLFQLPLEAVLKNSITLDHFLNYMASINSQHYVNLYLNIECWKASVNEHLCALELERLQQLSEEGQCVGDDTRSGASAGVMDDICHDYFSAHDLAVHKTEAEMIYEHYLSEKSNPRVNLEDSVVKRLILRQRSEKLNEKWFDETQQSLFTTLQEADLFLPGFRRSVWYIRLLAELDLLRDISRSDEEDSQSLDDVSLSCFDQQSSSQNSSQRPSPQVSSNPSPCHTRSHSYTAKPYTLTATISGTEIVRSEGNKSHAIYQVSVKKKDNLGQEEMWHVYRRYSEFHDFYLCITAKFLDLTSITFPSKKMLNNLAAWFLEKRMNELNKWLSRLLDAPTLQSHPGLQDAILKFVDHIPYHSTQQPANLAKRVEESLVTPIRVGVRSMSEVVRSVPDSVFNTVDEVVDGIYRKLVRPSHNVRLMNTPSSDICQRNTHDFESDENIPLRILLLLMDEVFDLRSKDQWFRSRIVLFLRQILKAMFGDIVNRRIVDYVAYITAPEQVANYVKAFRESVWPGGQLSPPPPSRDEEVKLRTKVAARTCMLASISDELKALLGSQTTTRGVVCVYECVQWQSLNKRLLYVLIGSLLECAFANHKQMPNLLRALISSSGRVSKRTGAQNRKTIKLM